MNIWNTIEELHRNYELFNLNKIVLDYESLKNYSFVVASTILEGATLTESETVLLLKGGIVVTGKHYEHHLMVQDNYDALKFVLQTAIIAGG